MTDMGKLSEKGPVAGYRAGGYFLLLTEKRLGTFKAGPTSDEEFSEDMPPLRSTFTVILGGTDKIRVTAERYIEQWGMENPVVRVGMIARVAPNESGLFHKIQTSAFLLSKKDRLALPAALTQTVRGNCRYTALNRFLPEGELILEQWEAGWAVTLCRSTVNGLRSTKISYGYTD